MAIEMVFFGDFVRMHDCRTTGVEARQRERETR